MRKIPWLACFCVVGVGTCFVNEASPAIQEVQRLQQQSDGNARSDAKLRLLKSLPIGIKIKQYPNPARARVGARSGFKFTWHSSHLSAIL